MKARIWVVVTMLVLSVAISAVSTIFVNSVMDSLDSARIEAVLTVENGNTDEAIAKITAMLTEIEEKNPILEILTPHDDLHDMLTQLVEAKVSLTIGDMDDFDQKIALFRENLEHIRSHEALTLSNIL